jgi:proline iminopeptidase
VTVASVTVFVLRMRLAWWVMNGTTSIDKLHLHQAPYDTGMLDVGDGHDVYYEQCGQPAGLPLVFLHGGPGSGCSPRHRQLFDLTRYRVIFFDQRGCGRSLPRGSVQANTSDHLVADIERLRLHMGIDRWLVVGGSWGAGLALAYAASHPAACLGLVLRGVFLGRTSDLDWFFQQAGQLLPDAWAAFVKHAPLAAQRGMLRWLYDKLHHGQPTQALEAASAWEAWETAVIQRNSAASRYALPTGQEAQTLLDKYSVQSHYLINACFWGDASLLERAWSLAAVPTAIIHGRLDWCCLPQAAWDLQMHLPGSRLQWLDDCGHSPFEPAMASAQADAIAHYASHGHFASWGNDFSKVDTR